MEKINDIQMKDIAIYGAGGLGREIACLLRSINDSMVEPQWNLIGFFDDGLPKDSCNKYGKILGGIDDLNQWKEDLAVVIAIGNSTIIKKIVGNIDNNLIYFPNIIHATSFADKKAVCMGKGNIITRGCHISCDVCIGDFNIMNGSVVFGHDVKIGSYNTFMPAVRISGGVLIGDENFFGVNSIILQQLTIGNHVRLGAGSVLMHKPKDGSLYIGNPAKLFKY